MYDWTEILDVYNYNSFFSGKLTLVQISTMNGQVFIFDVQTNPALFTMGKLEQLLQSKDIVKVNYSF